MANFLTVTNESGTPPHSSLLFERGDYPKKKLIWRGFFPTRRTIYFGFGNAGRVHSGKPGSGYARERYITTYARFEVDEHYLAYAERLMAINWKTGCDYVMGIRDCVTFAREMARACRLIVPTGFSYSPAMLVIFLAAWNTETRTHYVKHKSDNTKNYPWNP